MDFVLLWLVWLTIDLYILYIMALYYQNGNIYPEGDLLNSLNPIDNTIKINIFNARYV